MSLANMTEDTNGTDLMMMDCGQLEESDFVVVQQCSFWVEGVTMCVLGAVAIITNLLSIYVFTRYVKHNIWSLG